MIKLIDTDNVTFEMEQAYMLNRGARKCIREILLKAPEIVFSDCIISKNINKTARANDLEELMLTKLSEGM